MYDITKSLLTELMERAISNAIKTGNTFIIPQDEFAPGIWAGMEGNLINYRESEYKIQSIDLQTRTITVSPLSRIISRRGNL